MTRRGEVKTIVIVGGGTAGWMAAAALARYAGRGRAIRLIESDEIGTVGVGEATIPQIRLFNEGLGIPEEAFVRETLGSFKLGIEFVDWWKPGQRYFHGFGAVGQRLGLLPFHQYWLRYRAGGGRHGLWHFAPNFRAAAGNRFGRPIERPGAPSGVHHAYHFDASLYARMLRSYAEGRGVRRTEGKVAAVDLGGEDGFVEAVRLESGERVAGELFIDCTGFRGLLIEQTLRSGYEDWSHWLPCDRALAVPSERVAPLTPYTRSTAREAGWQWRIPLQHRTGNGMVYCSAFLDDEKAAETLLASLDGAALASPRPLRFTAGKRRAAWKKNCVAIGLAGGFLEPLESTSIHLIQSAIARLLAYFPDAAFDAADIAEYNAQTDIEWEAVRDFIILHYHLNARPGSEFWRHCREMVLPERLAQKIALFGASARITRHNLELFDDPSWLQVMWGQGLRPRAYHPLADGISDRELEEFIALAGQHAQRVVSEMPDHADYIAATCAAPIDERRAAAG
ncbi:tryptophan 7-halogenase [Sphingomonas parva]|uniref:Tryptophan 7-halogenase n=1 Tax=Sphingomonas parva TaxID=2555898 RepID=A0A4Y8ZSQ0_9SPHN|nr:tryptophan halogenase family protein [Sphingomonas parva]TFI58517.1 tryptophan 7-halogenase [Sphingomonas parva]